MCDGFFYEYFLKNRSEFLYLKIRERERSDRERERERRDEDLRTVEHHYTRTRKYLVSIIFPKDYQTKIDSIRLETRTRLRTFERESISTRVQIGDITQ